MPGFLTWAALAIGITTLVLTPVFYRLHEESLASVRSTNADQQGDLAHLQMQNDIIQSQLVEALMNLGNETILQQGTFIWGIGSFGFSDISQQCSSIAVTGYAKAASGSGYRVGDLITVASDAVQFLSQAVFNVTSVGGSGQVLTFTTLTPGCILSTPLTNVTMGTLSIVGTGFAVQFYAGPYPPVNQNVYYVYPTPPRRLVSPLQYANYTLKEVRLNSATYTVLQLDAPEFPMVMAVPPTMVSFIPSLLHPNLYQFDPPIPELQALGNAYYEFPLTRRNYNAISLTDDTSCYDNGIQCWLDAYDTSSRSLPNAFYLNYQYWGFDNQIAHPYIAWHFTSNGYAYNYLAHNTVLTLTEPLMLVLPSL